MADLRTQSLLNANDLDQDQKTALTGVIQELQDIAKRAAKIQSKLREIDTSLQEMDQPSKEGWVDRWRTKAKQGTTSQLKTSGIRK